MSRKPEFTPYWEWDTKLEKPECEHGPSYWCPIVYIHERRELIRACHKCQAYIVISPDSEEAKKAYPTHPCGGLEITQLDPNTFNKVTACTKCSFYEIRRLEDNELLS